MEIRQLNTFLVVAETLNFTQAAEQLHLAQSSVSAQIRALEKDLGVMLFDRIGKQVFLTDAGHRLLGYAKKIESMTVEIRTEVSGEKNLRGRLTVRMPESLARKYMPEVIYLYHSKYPDVHLNFINCSDSELPRELSSGRIDIALLMTDDTTMRDVSVDYLKTEELVLAASPAHELTKKSEISTTSLNGQLLLLPRTD